MRLIDADELIQEIKSLKIILNGKSILSDDAKDTILRIIDEQQTNYDIDKVVEALETNSVETEIPDEHIVAESNIQELYTAMVVELNKAIEIVRGGKND